MLPGESIQLPERKIVRELAQLGGALDGIGSRVSRAAVCAQKSPESGRSIVGMWCAMTPGARHIGCPAASFFPIEFLSVFLKLLGYVC